MLPSCSPTSGRLTGILSGAFTNSIHSEPQRKFPGYALPVDCLPFCKGDREARHGRAGDCSERVERDRILREGPVVAATAVVRRVLLPHALLHVAPGTAGGGGRMEPVFRDRQRDTAVAACGSKVRS